RWRDFYYDTRSPHADRYLGWHVNNKYLDGTPAFHPLERFSGRQEAGGARAGGFHRPDKVWPTILRAFNNPDPVTFTNVEPPVLAVGVARGGGKPLAGATVKVSVKDR